MKATPIPIEKGHSKNHASVEEDKGKINYMEMSMTWTGTPLRLLAIGLEYKLVPLCKRVLIETMRE